MSTATEHLHDAENRSDPVATHSELHKIVLEELDRVLASRYFKNSLRSRQFLEYIVRRTLEGRAEELKERTIGMELFQRLPNYATGEDPVVRLQATEVRRRLKNYYQSETETVHAPVRIELTVGSYAPKFHLRTPEPTAKPEEEVPLYCPQRARNLPVSLSRGFIVALVVCAVGALAGFPWVNARHSAAPLSSTEQFWGPALASQQPLLICLAKPVVYRPTLELYRRYSSTHPNTFQTEVERSNRVLPLDPDFKLVWSEMTPYPDYGVALGDVEAAAGISALFGQLRKPIQVRIGDHYSFDDLHNSPSVLVGAFNNKWTMQILSGLRFEFVEENGKYAIRENIPKGRKWYASYDQSQRAGRDFAIVGRLLDSNTGQFAVIAAGLSGGGTQAAGDFVSHPNLLERALHELPAGWQKENIEFVLQTDVTDAVAESPRVVAFNTW